MRFDYMKIKKDEPLRILIGVLITVFILSFDVGAFAADAIECGDTIGPNESVTLNGNLDCSTTGETALTVRGPARLNLNGFSVFGASGQYGIVVRGKAATILNGTIRGARRGIRLRDDGHHQVLNVTVVECSDPDDASSRRGIQVQSDHNKLINNYIVGCNKGIRVDEETRNNEVVGNTMHDNDAENCDVKGVKNVIVNNIADGGSEECFLIGDLEDPEVGANENRVINNTALNCEEGGFVAAEGTSGNYFVNNTAEGNSEFDLIDGNGNCTDNKWNNNTATSGDPDCTYLK